MKNLFYPTLIALGMLVSSGCEKDEKNLVGVEGSTSGEVKQPSILSTVNELIAATDQKYGTNYTGRINSKSGNFTYETSEPDVELMGKGVWVFGKDPSTGYCDLPLCAKVKSGMCICGIIITASARGPKPLMDIILNSADSPYLIKNVKEIESSDFKDNDGNIIRTEYEFIK